MKKLDFHIHTTMSDGMFSPEKVVKLAQECEIDLLAITDHNYTFDLTELRKKFPNINFVQGSEISCLYHYDNDKHCELHVVALGFDPDNAKIKTIFKKNSFDRKKYVQSILDKLKECDIDIGSFEDLRKEYPESRHIGRSQIAKKMLNLGYVNSAEEAFDVYIGSFGERRAYIESSLNFVSLEECIDAIKDAGGIAVLAHLFYYQLDDNQNHKLIKYFKDLAGEQAAMETEYSRYDEPQRNYLKALACEYKVMQSAGSDFHGKDESETLNCDFKCKNFQEIIHKLLKL